MNENMGELGKSIGIYIPSPLIKADLNIHLPLYSGLVPMRPTITLSPCKDDPPVKQPEPKRVKVRRTKRYFLFGVVWDKASRTLYVFIPMLYIEILLK